MFKTVMAGIGIVLMASTFWVPTSVYGWGGTLTLTYNSIHCSDVISGGTRQTVNDGAASCAIDIKEIGTVCKNPQGKSDTSSSHLFAIQGTTIQEGQNGSSFLIQKNGQFLSDIFFSQTEIQQALGSQFPTLDPAVLCPNKNWKVVWGVTKFDMVATVNNVQNGYVPVFPSLNEQDTVNGFQSCNPTNSGLTYTLPGVCDTAVTHTCTSGTNSGHSCTTDLDCNNAPNAGILNECWLFRNKTFVDTSFNGTDSGGVQLLDLTFTPGAFYNGVCQEHGKQTGSLGNVTGFTDSGPSPTDLECTGGDTVLDGSY
jgi:hypothetical protein